MNDLLVIFGNHQELVLLVLYKAACLFDAQLVIAHFRLECHLSPSLLVDESCEAEDRLGAEKQL